MCLLAFYFQSFDDCPLVVAANRDEVLARPSAPPQVLREKPLVYGGKDLQSGGTWLGINEHGLFVGILNRRSQIDEREPFRSRGLLCLDLLGAKSSDRARDELMRHQDFLYRPFNLVFADAQAAYAAYNENCRISSQRLEKGLHVFGNAPVLSPRSQKLVHAHELFQPAAEVLRLDGVGPKSIQILQTALSDHWGANDNGPKDAICVHMPSYGTVSSSLLFYNQNDKSFTTYYAAGPPCQNPYAKGLSISVS
jgi:uncharacterized protein with NRDE domain